MNVSQKVEWDKHWTPLSNTVTERDVYHILDETKLAYLKPLLPRSGRSLEVGCGSARLSYFLAKAGYDTYGLDYSRVALAVAHENFRLAGARGTFVEGNALDLPFEDGCFDVVLSTGLLEHFVDPMSVVFEMVRVLRPGGVFYSDIVPDKFSLLRLFDALKRTEEVFERKLDRAAISRLLQCASLRDIVVFPAGVTPPLWIPFLHRWGPYIVLHARVTEALMPWFVDFDDTVVAEWLGFYYFCIAQKAL